MFLKKYFAFFLILCATFGYAQVTKGPFIKTDLFSIDRDKLFGEGNFTYRLAVDADEVIAFNSCSEPYVYFLSSNGDILDKIELEYKGCLRNMEFDEFDNLLMMDNEETKIYKYIRRTKTVEILPYNKPEDWYKNINHFYKFFEIASIPTYYNNPDYYQDFFKTRFHYSYNLWLNYEDGFIYQFAYNFIKKVGNHKIFTALRKSDLWFSDRLSNKCKPLLVNLQNETAVYYDRALNLYYEDFKNGLLYEWPCAEGHDEAVQLDYSTNKNQKKIWGVGFFDSKKVTFSTWQVK